MAENFELEILLKVKAQLNDLIKVKQGLKDVSNETKGITSANRDVDSSFGSSITNMQRGLRGILNPITMLRRTIFQVGLAWSLTGGTAIAAIKDIEKKTRELQDISIKTGKSVEEISKEYYGFNIATKEASVVSIELLKIQQDLSNVWTKSASGITNFIGALEMAAQKNEIVGKKIRAFQEKQGIFGAGPSSAQVRKFEEEAEKEFAEKSEKKRKATLRNTDEFRKMSIAAQEEINKSNLSGFEYKKSLIERDLAVYKSWEASEDEVDNLRKARMKDLDNERLAQKDKLSIELFKLQGNERAALTRHLSDEEEQYRKMWGEDGQLMQMYRTNVDLQIQEFDRARLGLITNQQAMEGFTKQSVSAMKSSFTSFFQDAFGGQLKTAREYFMAFLQDIVNAWSRAMAEMVVNQILPPGQQKPSKTSTALGIVSSIASIFGGGGTAGIVNLASGPVLAAPANYYKSPAAQITPRAGGGWLGLNGPEIGLVGEVEPEMVTPLSKMGNMGGTQTKNVYYFIQAVDPRSFAEIVASNPDAIVAVTERAIESNKKIRRTIRSLT